VAVYASSLFVTSSSFFHQSSLYGLFSSVNFRFFLPLFQLALVLTTARSVFDSYFTYSTLFFVETKQPTINMYTKLAVVATLLAAAEARFGQEGLIQNLVQGLGDFGQPGQAGTLAGQTPGVLLAGANACAKVR